MKADETLMEVLHGKLVEELISRIAEGRASPSDLNVARQMLKDNNISCDGPRSPQMNRLMDNMPDLAELAGLEQ